MFSRQRRVELELCRSHALALMKNWGYQLVYPYLRVSGFSFMGMDPGA